MIYLLISIFCSVTVGVLLKLAKRYKINIPQAVTWNYLFAIGLSIFFFKPSFKDLTTTAHYDIYLALGVLLPLIFWFLAASVKAIGIARTDIAQRLSLFIPLLAAYFLFKEHFTITKICGLTIGFAAIFLTLYKKTKQRNSLGTWFYPLIVLLGYGLIDILFKQVAQIRSIPYTTSLTIIFFLSFIIAMITLLYLRAFKNQKLELVNFLCGCVLGFFNFFNILFYLKAHGAMAENPSVVFASMNMGVIILGSLIGIFIFKEKLNKLNYWGLFLALLSIITITISRLYAI